MEKELVEQFEKVKKAADASAAADGGVNSSPEEDRCLDALNRLKKLPINYDVLVSTQIGKRLRQLTKHPRKRIQALASDVVEMWKGIIVKETAKNRKNWNMEHEGSVKAEPGDADSGEKKKVGRVNSIKVQDSVKAEPAGTDSDNGKKFQRESSVKVEKVSTAGPGRIERVDHSFSSNSEKVMKFGTSSTELKVENIDGSEAGKSSSGEHIKAEKITEVQRSNSDLRKQTPAPTTPKLTSLLYTKDQIRDRVRELCVEALCKVATEVGEDLREEVDACDPYRIAIMVETAMFEKWGRSNSAQKFKYRSILFNIKDSKNPDFRRKVLLGQFPPHSVVDLTPEDMASDARKNQNEKIKEKALFECERGGPPKATTSEFRCGRCGKHETTYYQMQTRSADEPMTTYITCVVCNNRWKK